MFLRIAMMTALTATLLVSGLGADEPKRNPWRDGTGHGVMDIAKPRMPLTPAERAQLDKDILSLEGEMRDSALKFTEQRLQWQIMNLEFKLAMQYRDSQFPSAETLELAQKIEAKIRAEEVMHQMRRDAVTAQLREHVTEEAKLSTELRRLRALPKKPEDGSIRKALERLDDVRQLVDGAKADLIHIEERQLDELNHMKRDLERAKSERGDPEDTIPQEIEATRAILAEVRAQQLRDKLKIGTPEHESNGRILKELQELRAEVRQLRERQEK